MTKREVSFSDLSGQMATEPDGLIPLVVTDFPDSDPDQRSRIEVTKDELEKIGKMAIATVGLETEPTDEEEKRTRLVVPFGKLAALATVGRLEEVLANAEPVEPPKAQRRSQNGERRSHNTRADGGPLNKWSDPEKAGYDHPGTPGKGEAEYVRNNLEEVNVRRVAAGQEPINPMNPMHARRYGFPAPEQPTAE